MAAVSTKKQIREKEKVEQRKRLDEIKSLALRQGYVTEDQIVWLLDDDLDPEKQVQQMEDIHSMLNTMHIEVFASEEEAHERAKKLRKLEDKKPAPSSKAVPPTPVRYDDPDRTWLYLDPQNGLVHYNLACYWSLAGNKRQALLFLAQALDLDPNFRDLVSAESDFDLVRNDPAFRALTSVIV